MKSSHSVLPATTAILDPGPDSEKRWVEEEGRLLEAAPGAMVMVSQEPVVTINPARPLFANDLTYVDRARAAQ